MSNIFSFTGTVGKDAEVRHTPAGLSVLNVTVANNVGFGDKQKTLWLRVVVFGKRAEGQLVNYLKKGQQVFISGELTQSEYKNNDGTTKTSLELNATIVDLIGKKQEPAPQSQHHQQKSDAYQPQKKDNFDNDFDDDIPF